MVYLDCPWRSGRAVLRDYERPNERVSSPIVTFSDLMRENKFCVRVDATPEPIIAALCLIVLIQAMLYFFVLAQR